MPIISLCSTRYSSLAWKFKLLPVKQTESSTLQGPAQSPMTIKVDADVS